MTRVLWQKSFKFTSKDSVLVSFCCSNKQPQTLESLQKQMCISLLRHVRAGVWLWFCCLRWISLGFPGPFLIQDLGCRRSHLEHAVLMTEGKISRDFCSDMNVPHVCTMSHGQDQHQWGRKVSFTYRKEWQRQGGSNNCKQIIQSTKDGFLNIGTIQLSVKYHFTNSFNLLL